MTRRKKQKNNQETRSKHSNHEYRHLSFLNSPISFNFNKSKGVLRRSNEFCDFGTKVDLALRYRKSYRSSVSVLLTA